MEGFYRKPTRRHEPVDGRGDPHKSHTTITSTNKTIGKTAELSLKDAQTTVAEKKQAGKKKKVVQEVVIARAIRNKKKCVTTVSGLDTFGVKLSEAAKVFGKKFACGASVTKTAAGGEEIDIQVCSVVWVSDAIIFGAALVCCECD